MQDFSTDKEFWFGFPCVECGKLWCGKPIPFSKAGIAPENEKKKIIYDALYQREKNFARDTMLAHALEHFSICPICHRLICDCCFLLCDEIEMCRSCAEKLGESGEAVSPEDLSDALEEHVSD